MTNLGVDLQALTSASGLLSTAADEFARARGQVSGMSGAQGATAEVTELLEQALGALASALGRAEAELQQVAGHLSSTADAYARTEQALAAWHVPGMGGTSGGGG